MKAWSESEEEEIKIRLAVTIYKMLKVNNIQSIRSLASSASLEYAHLQKVLAGKINISFTTLYAIVNTMKVSMESFGSCYDNITKADILDYQNGKKERSSKRVNKKTKKG